MILGEESDDDEEEEAAGVEGKLKRRWWRRGIGVWWCSGRSKVRKEWF